MIDTGNEVKKDLHGMRFAIIGAAGYVAVKHLRAIHETGNTVIASVDPNDSVGVLDGVFPESRFFTEIERFDRYLEKLRRPVINCPVDYVSICSPNYLHDAHVRLALRVGAHAICEKPLVVNPWNLEQLSMLEQEYGRRVYTVLQLRLHKELRSLKRSLEMEENRTRRNVCLTYITRRGPWYNVSWKGDEEKSGGLAMNIGVHFFDILLWLFGPVVKCVVHQSTPTKIAGYLELEWARVRWFLSIDKNDLPTSCLKQGQYAWRSISIDGNELDFTEGCDSLHTAVYRDIVSGGGFGIDDATPSIGLIYDIRNSSVQPSPINMVHPVLH